MSTLLTLLVLTVVPLLFLSATSFVKLSVVLSILRNALGTGQVPSGAVITVLAVLLSLYIMSPVGESMYRAATPHAAGIDIDRPFAEASFDAWVETIGSASKPLKSFLEANAGKRELALFFELAKKSRADAVSAEVRRDDFLVLLPAFLFTELTEAFMIGFLVFLPFLVLDLLVANVVLSLGLQTMNPTTISLPFKLLLFVAVDGWYVLAEALVLGYASGVS